MDQSERAVALAQAPMFYGLPDEVLRRLAAVAEEIEPAGGETFIEAGAVEPWMFLMVSGGARVHSGGRTLAAVTPGSTVGELAVLDPAPRSADVTATEPSHLLRIDHAPLSDLMQEFPALTESIISVLVRVIRASSDRIGPGPVSAV